MHRRGLELVYALVAMAAVTAGYVWLYQVRGTLPGASSLFGHMMGLVGVTLMLATETLYSLRKRSHKSTLGSSASWLRFHIVTGLVGPYLVVLHSGLQFKGLAGITTAFTGVVVASGVLGRYLYTAVGSAHEGGRRALATWRSFHVPLTWVLFALATIHSVIALAYGALQR